MLLFSPTCTVKENKEKKPEGQKLPNFPHLSSKTHDETARLITDDPNQATLSLMVPWEP